MWKIWVLALGEGDGLVEGAFLFSFSDAVLAPDTGYLIRDVSTLVASLRHPEIFWTMLWLKSRSR